MSPRRALFLLIAFTAILRLGWASCIGLGNDEAYHALFVRHPDWSYYDHPPMMAVVEAIGLTTARVVGPVLALRLGFIALFAGSTLLMARLASRFFGEWAGFLAAFILNVSAYQTAAASTFALPDGPLLFFWLLTLDRLAVALESPGRSWPWIVVGLAWGGAFLSKYHAVFLPMGALLYLVLEPSARFWLRRPGPYLAVLVGMVLFAPVIIWNANHGWASFAFQSSRAVGVSFRPDCVLAFLGGQALYLLPWMWLFLIGAMVRHRHSLWRPDGPPAVRFLLCQAIPVLGAFLAVSCVRPALPHWSLVGFLSIMALLGADWAAWSAASPVRFRRRVVFLAMVPVVGMSLFAAQTRWGIFQREGHGLLGILPARHDPSLTLDMYGWDQVARALRERHLLDEPGTFLFTDRWYQSGHLAFELPGPVPVLCYAVDAHAFAQWSRPEDWVGRNGVLIVMNESKALPEMFEPWFERIEPLGTIEIERAGGVVRLAHAYHCIGQTKPFPFDGREPDHRVAAYVRSDAPVKVE